MAQRREDSSIPVRWAGSEQERAMSTPELVHVRLSRVDDVVVVEIVTQNLQGPAAAQELGAELRRIAAQDWAKKLLLNFHRVQYLSSTVFGVLFRVALEVKNAGRLMKVCNMEPNVRLGADIVHLDTVVEIYETEDAALKSFKAG
jgi:anti-anti-sigma factor